MCYGVKDVRALFYIHNNNVKGRKTHPTILFLYMRMRMGSDHRKCVPKFVFKFT